MAEKYYRALVIGTGCAGYRAAEHLYECGVRDIAIVTEGVNMGTSRNTGSDKQTYYKLSLCGSDGDSVREMAGTLFAGGAVNGDIALAEAAGSVRGFMHLVDLGVPFPANEYGEFVGYKTDHDPRQRATSCGPLTSKLMTEALERSVREKGIEVLDRLQVIKILTDGGEEKPHVRGIACLDASGDVSVLGCGCVVMATGGPAGIYENVVYPESQHGSTGLALEAGAAAANLDQWQYGIASTKFRWNLSGTYQQVLPKYLSADADGGDLREFLPDAEYLGSSAEALNMVFLKGYQWPFDVSRLGEGGSSRVDMAVYRELQRGRRVFLDFRTEPSGLENGFGVLSDEAYNYLKNSGALLTTPIARLEKMNPKAIELYMSHGIDLRRELLEISVCAQHCNGGVDVNADWQTCVDGLYTVGEAAGTFGLRRPGGSALNSTQVGAMRAAEHIAKRAAASDSDAECGLPGFTLPDFLRNSGIRPSELLEKLRRDMSSYASFFRDTMKMREMTEEYGRLLENYGALVGVWSDGGKDGIGAYYRLRDALITARSVLSAMLYTAQVRGTHGSSLIDGNADGIAPSDGSFMTVTRGGVSFSRPVRPVPDAELWFENVFNRR